MRDRIRFLIRSLFRRKTVEREMQHETDDHLERSIDRLMARGLSREQADHEARREFGNVGYLQEEGRIARGTSWWDALRADLRFALRQFARKPLSTVAMILVLGIGIGINAVLFTMVQGTSGEPAGRDYDHRRRRTRRNGDRDVDSGTPGRGGGSGGYAAAGVNASWKQPAPSDQLPPFPLSLCERVGVRATLSHPEWRRLPGTACLDQPWIPAFAGMTTASCNPWRPSRLCGE